MRRNSRHFKKGGQEAYFLFFHAEDVIATDHFKNFIDTNFE